MHAQHQYTTAAGAGSLHVLHSLDGQALAQVDAMIAQGAGQFGQSFASADEGAVAELVALLVAQFGEAQINIGLGNTAAIAVLQPGQLAKHPTKPYQHCPGKLPDQPEQRHAQPRQPVGWV